MGEEEKEGRVLEDKDRSQQWQRLKKMFNVNK